LYADLAKSERGAIAAGTGFRTLAVVRDAHHDLPGLVRHGFQADPDQSGAPVPYGVQNAFPDEAIDRQFRQLAEAGAFDLWVDVQHDPRFGCNVAKPGDELG